MNETTERPRFTGKFKYTDEEGGYGLWIPSGWHRTDLADGRQGVIFSPYPNDLNTCFMAERQALDVSIKPKDLAILRKGFLQGLESLPGIEIESHEESVGSAGVILLEARFTFLEGEERRKRWVRVSYWGNGQLTFIAQGASEEIFDYWVPAFYNIMMTVEL
ncbi:MAG: hypothetical protein ACOX9A_08100 [Anaerolineae bacterium]|jgi:hypothetical protein